VLPEKRIVDVVVDDDDDVDFNIIWIGVTDIVKVIVTFV
jgi:hypothetical protein